jgi:hypothetical protein
VPVSEHWVVLFSVCQKGLLSDVHFCFLVPPAEAESRWLPLHSSNFTGRLVHGVVHCLAEIDFLLTCVNENTSMATPRCLSIEDNIKVACQE